MPWEEVSIMSQRREFVTLAQREGSDIRELCRRFKISPTTGYKWLGRFRGGGVAGLAELARRPHRSPGRTAPEMERSVLQVRNAHPAWGGRKLRAWLLARGHQGVPSPSIITAILQRHGRIDPSLAEQHRLGNASNMRSPISFGRWTSRVTSPWEKAAATPSRCWMIIPASLWA